MTVPRERNPRVGNGEKPGRVFRVEFTHSPAGVKGASVNARGRCYFHLQRNLSSAPLPPLGVTRAEKFSGNSRVYALARVRVQRGKDASPPDPGRRRWYYTTVVARERPSANQIYYPLL